MTQSMSLLNREGSSNKVPSSVDSLSLGGHGGGDWFAS